MREALFYATKYGPTDSVADRKRLEAEELWQKLIKVRKERRGDVSVAHAVCVSNLAVLVAIRGRANKSMLQLQEAVEQAQAAIGLAGRLLEDRIRAEAASTKCLFEIYHQALLDWDKAFAILATNEAKQDHKRQAKISLLGRGTVVTDEGGNRGRRSSSHHRGPSEEFGLVPRKHDAAALQFKIRDGRFCEDQTC